MFYSWLTKILPFIEQDNVYNTTVKNSYTSNALIKTFQAPGDPTLPASGQTWGNRGASERRYLLRATTVGRRMPASCSVRSSYLSRRPRSHSPPVAAAPR